jgi:DNA-binding GntR family transcriptional regulator
MQKSRPYSSKKEYTYEVLRAEILNGDLTPGTRLVIDAIAERLGVSPIPVREALQQLEFEGLVTQEPYMGARVSEIHAGLIHEIFGLLEATERISSQQACLRMNDEEFDRIEQILEEMDASVDSIEEWSQMNMVLHQFICEQAGTSLVKRTMNLVLDHWNRLRRHYLTEVSARRVHAAQAEHWQLLEALRTRNTETVAQIVRQHNEQALADYLRYLEQSGLLNSTRK